jgi:hypothetical protein
MSSSFDNTLPRPSSTEHCFSVNTRASYSGGHGYADWGSSRYSSVPPGKCRDITLKLDTTVSCHVHSNSLFVSGLRRSPSPECGVPLASDVSFPTGPHFESCYPRRYAFCQRCPLSWLISGSSRDNFVVLRDELGNGHIQRTCLFSQGNPRGYMELG